MSENNSAVKATKTIHDMTTGSPAKLIVQFMIPMFLGNIFQQFYNVADSIIAGQFLGVRALAAIGSTGSLMFIVTALSGKYGKEEVEEAIDEVQTLIKNEELFTKDTYENYMMDFKKRPTVVKALCLHIAHDCNLACRYCFAEEGEDHGRRALMSFETGKKALDFLIANSGNRRNLEVDFFGGEPLMNWQVVKDLVAYGREQEKIHNKNFRFTLTTNGVLLND